MNFFKKNIKAIIGFIVGVILASSITVYAYSYIASDVKYTKNEEGTEIEISVEQALNELYTKYNKCKIPSTSNVIYENNNPSWGDNEWISTVSGYIVVCVNANNSSPRKCSNINFKWRRN